MRRTVLPTALFLLLGVTAGAGCGDPLSLLPAVFQNRVDTLSLYAANRTPVTQASGYLIAQRSAVRLDQVTNFDFLYDVTAEGDHVFLPLGALIPTGRTTGNPGFQITTEHFDSITIAVQQGYVTADTLHLRLGEVYYARSSVDPSCGLGIPYYAKLQVLGFDDAARKVTFQILANVNCGYRGLELGLPTK